ncbi:MAG TPA: uroporphyrinogen decarboxylase [Stellaceae bacterium]|nr:uroporphyrinogen decarboxylase [Stellaceae bacterium]
MAGGSTRRLVRALRGETLRQPPWWLMRQAGRYLPEYRTLRAQADNFIDFCLTPALAAEATVQPIRRFGMDAAILFADILLIPRALGQQVGFGDNGPVLQALVENTGIVGLGISGLSVLDPVYETIVRSRSMLPPETALIGFAGSPWTVATYMVEGGASRYYPRVKGWAYRDPAGFAALIELLVEATVAYLTEQAAAGADAVQLFDSWAGVLSSAEFERWVVEPTQRIVKRVKERFVDLPIIGFPRGAGMSIERYAAATGVDAVALDTSVSPAFARDRLQNRMAVQGNLDPIALMVGGRAMEDAVRRIVADLAAGPFVFNLGHGVLPQTPPAHVTALAGLLRDIADGG